MARVTFNFWAGARAAAGTSSETVDADTLTEAVAVLVDRHADTRFARVVRASSLLADGVSVSPDAADTPLRGAVTVEVLPPFAGG